MDFLAKTSDGAPVILLHDSSAPRYRPGFHLKYLRAEFHTTCLIRSGDAEVDGQFAMIYCDAAAIELHEMFVRAVAAAIADLPIHADTDDIQRRFQKLSDLFRNFSRPSSRELIGMWAELFVIANSNNIYAAMSAWRTDPGERFDFSWHGGQLEVKATTKAIRSHDFSLEQLRTPKKGDGFIVSFLLQSLNGGVGIMDLATVIEANISSHPELRQKLWNNIASDLGADFGETGDKKFDSSYAGRNAVLYAMRDIPSPQFQPDPRITSIRFVADLTSVLSTATGHSLESLLA